MTETTPHDKLVHPLTIYTRGSASTGGRPLLTLENNIGLAPMAGASDWSYRKLCRRMGAGLTYTELVSARGIRYSGLEPSLRYLFMSADEQPVALQLFGFDPEDFRAACRTILETELFPRPALLDVNMGCPVPKVTKTGAGSALMLDPGRAAEIIEACREVMEPAGIPVSCKFRRGFNHGDNTAASFALRMLKAGASLLCVHGRTRDQMYSGLADRGCIRETVEAVHAYCADHGLPPVPVLANGDATDVAGTRALLLETGADGVLVGRGAMGNPWLFRDLVTCLDAPPGTKPEPPTVPEKIEAAREQFLASIQLHGEETAAREMRKVLSWYLKGTPGAAALRRDAVAVSSLADFEHFAGLWSELTTPPLIKNPQQNSLPEGK